jgi:hypothetical protein
MNRGASLSGDEIEILAGKKTRLDKPQFLENTAGQNY